jgi:hypothetical protein
MGGPLSVLTLRAKDLDGANIPNPDSWDCLDCGVNTAPGHPTGCSMNSVFIVPTPQWQVRRKQKLLKAAAAVKDRIAADKSAYAERLAQPWPIVKPRTRSSA